MNPMANPAPVSTDDAPRYLISDLMDLLESYLEPGQVREIYRAYLFGAEAHNGQHRMSGEPYIYLPIAAARILAELRLDGVGDHHAVLAADQARRDMLRRPARAATASRPARDERGVFALRAPMRPNPIAAMVVEIVAIRGNEVDVRGLDCLDGTPLVDIKRPVFFDAGDGRTAS